MFSALHDRTYAPSSTAANLSYLPGSSHPEVGVLTSFVLPIHNQVVSLALLQCHALWRIFLPTTGTFFYINLTDLTGMPPVPAPFGGRFTRTSDMSPICLPQLNPVLESWAQAPNSTVATYFSFLLLCHFLSDSGNSGLCHLCL